MFANGLLSQSSSYLYNVAVPPPGHFSFWTISVFFCPSVTLQKQLLFCNFLVATIMILNILLTGLPSRLICFDDVPAPLPVWEAMMSVSRAHCAPWRCEWQVRFTDEVTESPAKLYIQGYTVREWGVAIDSPSGWLSTQPDLLAPGRLSRRTGFSQLGGDFTRCVKLEL